jgi:hypothetical protein
MRKGIALEFSLMRILFSSDFRMGENWQLKFFMSI